LELHSEGGKKLNAESKILTRFFPNILPRVPDNIIQIFNRKFLGQATVHAKREKSFLKYVREKF
jgi:hypothetical protein